MRADAVVAVGDDLGVAVELAEAVRQLTQRDQPGALDVGDLPLVRLAHVDQDQLVALLVPLLLELLRH